MKWNEPAEPIPSWLDPSAEVTQATDNKPAWQSLSLTKLKPAFVRACYETLRGLGLTPWQALEILGNAVVETGWGQHFRAWNLGGWKIRKVDVHALKAQGKMARWWRAPGNKAPGATLKDLRGGDPPWCYYRGFDSMEAFFSEWLQRFVPKQNVNDNHRYKKTGEQFWANSSSWFQELCLAGYKGANTQRNPTGSVASHHQITKLALIYLCQQQLGLDPDGIWGPKSQAACKAAEKQKGLPETGNPSLIILK